MNVNLFAQQIEDIHWRLAALYQGANSLVQLPPELLPVAFKELGIASEKLQVAAEELHQQNEELATAQVTVEAERQRYQELFEFAPNAYLVTDAVGIIREANRAAATLLNVSQRFLVGKPLSVFVNENERHAFRSQLLLSQQAKQVQEWSVRLQPRNRESCEALLRVATVRDREGKPVTLRMCVREVTECKRAEAAIERKGYDPSQDRLKQVYLKGEIVPLKPQTIWQVCQGIVKLSTVCENGEEVFVGLAGPSMPFGPDLTSLRTYQATALSEVHLVSFSLTEIAASPELTQTFLTQINQRLRQTEAFLAISGQRRVKERFYNLLMLLKQEIGQPMAQGTRLSVRFTHQDFAEACSTTRVTITRLLGQLQQQGKIDIDFHNHIILRSD